MSVERIDALTSRKPLRLWPGVAAAVLLLLARFGLPRVFPEQAIYGILGAVVAGLLILVWWLFFSRAPWSERIGAVVLMVGAVYGTQYIVHESISGGLMGRMLPLLLGVPFMNLALVAWAVATRSLGWKPRRVALLATILLTCGAFALLRTDGVTGDGLSQLTWRWKPTAEDRLLAQANVEPPPAPVPVESPKEPVVAKPADAPAAPSAAPTATKTERPSPVTAKTQAEWPGFRGPERDGIVHGVRIETDWSKSPPVELWRRPIGPGWSSFAVDGDVLYTQEQRGEHEVVASYKVSTGQPVWQHRDAVRFWESNAGAGPRGTPTLSHGRVYTFGATGIVNALNAGSGAVIWSRNAGTDTGEEVPVWAFASSPLVVGDLVVIAAAGRLVAYDAATGQQRWLGPAGGAGYSSPHLATIDGVPQILLLRGSRTISVAPADGSLFWEHKWEPGVGIVQPAVAEKDGVLLTTSDAMGGVGIRRIAVSHSSLDSARDRPLDSARDRPSGWTVEERWTSRGLKPYFSDFVVHKGNALGFDGSILACIDLADGNRKWKGGRYGSGQLILLPDQDVLLVLSEEGELALVSATPDKFRELARFKAIEGKSWSHPVLVRDTLLVRNGEEMAAFRLSIAPR
jgi:outer membrane protein assembly factor BamB